MITLVREREVYADGRHNALTDLVYFDGRYFLAFRNGGGHRTHDGRVVVLESADAIDWRPQARIAHPNNFDLRDPKFLSTGDRLILNLCGRRPPGRLFTCQSILEADGSWCAAQHIRCCEDYFLWRAKRGPDGAWYAFGYAYRPSGLSDWSTLLFRSPDGLAWDRHADIWHGNGVNEGAIEFLPSGEAVALVRFEATPGHTRIGRAQPPYTSWRWTDSGMVFQGPLLRRIGDVLLAAGRFYEPRNGEFVPRTGVFTLEGGQLIHRLTLTSGGDTSYCGLVMEDDRLLLSYYSSHASQETTPAGTEPPSAIYLAELALDSGR